ncbi:MAG TPA: 50S ribosomal protein L10 [Smithellaceae bacterium]|nr:50S ribosomal protein L10 [Syntrophaceae bacterium]HOE79573.1 50S ribosomal protein L10 [Smithellaceae bacterium]HPL96114.1 50S ribosomal protein L10 [Smithellaceae bacterium]HPV48840.1 50S ribosomal protein L10 [Smithellaceae bacterium]HQF84089.1 50S ribosomal protein L10 [Smithellaceae bacterium]
MDRKTKEQIVSGLQEKLKQANLGVLTSFNAMKVEKMEALRNALRKNDAELKVVKNTLLNIAAKETDFQILAEHFKWPVAVVLSYKDPVAPTKALIDFAKKNPELEIKVGIIDGKVLSKADIEALAELPSREVLLGKLVSVMAAVPTSFVSVLSGVQRSFVQVLGAYCDKKNTLN